MEITGSNASPVGGVDVYYYYFYDLEVGKTSCWGDSVAVIATVTDTADFSFAANGFTVNFTDLTPQATSWDWNFGDGNTSTLQNPTHTYAQNGLYTVTLSVNGGSCVVTYVVNIGGIGLDEVDKNNAISIYPNPAKTELNIDFKEGNNAGAKLTLYSLKGQKVKEVYISADEDNVTMQLNGLVSDLYMLEIEMGETRFYQKVMIVR